MNLQLLTGAIDFFKDHLRSNRKKNHLYLYESQKNWQQTWDIENLDLKSTYDRSLQNSETRRLWVGDNYRPKEMMLRFMPMQKEFMRDMFRDLFNEEKDIIGRMDRFIFHSDILLEEFKNINRSSIENRHFHDDNYRIISLYLAFEFPEQYAFYQYQDFPEFLKRIGSKDLPKVNDLNRFFKVMRTVYKFMEKDGEVLDLHQKRLEPGRHFEGKSLLLASEMCRVVVGG